MSQLQITGNQSKALKIGQRLLTGAKSFGKGVRASVGEDGSNFIKKTARKIKRDQKIINKENKRQKRFEAAVKEEAERREKLSDGGGEYKTKITAKGMVKNALVSPFKALKQIIIAWSIQNLPKIIEEVRKFTKKVKIVVASVTNAVKASGDLFQGWLSYGKAWMQNMVTFDWNDSTGRLKDAEEQIGDAQGELSASFDTMYNVWGKEEDELDAMLAHLRSGKTIQETVDAIVSGAPVPVFPQTPMFGAGAESDGGFRGTANTYGMSQDAVTDTKWKPILNLIASAESVDGSYDSIYPSGTKSGLSNMTIEEADAWQASTASARGSAAAGRYQFMNIKDQAAAAGIGPNEKFSPQNQDKMAIALITKKKGVNFDMLRNDPAQAQMLLSQEWAGLAKDRTNKSYYSGDGMNEAGVTTTEIRGSFQSALDGGVSGPQGGGQPGGTITGGVTTDSDSLQVGDKVSGFGVSSAMGMRYHPVRGGKKSHGGLDIATPQGTYLAFSVSVEIIAAGSYGGYGYLVDAWSEELGVQFRCAHLSSIMCSPGQRVKPGAAIARTGGAGGSRGAGTSTGPHLHFEVSTHKGSANYGGSNNANLTSSHAKYLLLSASEPKINKLNVSNMSSNARLTAQELSSSAASNRTNGRKETTHVVVATQKTIVATN